MKLIFGIEFLGTSNMNMDFHSSIPIIIITMELSKKKKKKKNIREKSFLASCLKLPKPLKFYVVHAPCDPSRLCCGPSKCTRDRNARTMS